VIKAEIIKQCYGVKMKTGEGDKATDIAHEAIENESLSISILAMKKIYKGRGGERTVTCVSHIISSFKQLKASFTQPQ
jgi:hypothetical protein